MNSARNTGLNKPPKLIINCLASFNSECEDCSCLSTRPTGIKLQTKAVTTWLAIISESLVAKPGMQKDVEYLVLMFHCDNPLEKKEHKMENVEKRDKIHMVHVNVGSFLELFVEGYEQSVEDVDEK
ncbi:hypothetical protein BpHYR1_035874 [Brachionus plicatilis]|uniref:Uncharacterized protein n=1 Tax=Brachionus plicatilis TaxID=10195 RepID=A0A3M7SKB7_BRAPC|nr:hypothetical protein BpHYR1_035874 [Brachionus plicatilis]